MDSKIKQSDAHSTAGLVLFICLLRCFGSVLGEGPSAPKNADEFFLDTKVWEVEFTMMPENYASLEPQGRRRFGADFDYVRANVRIAGQAFKDAGLRYKGNSSFSTARGVPKKSFKIDFNRYVKGQKFLGLTKINLNNNILDPSQIREALAYRLWQRMKLPAPRTAFARVTLTVPDHFDRKFLGLYVVVEQVNGPYLKHRFGTDDGLLLKPERSLAMPYLGESFKEYERVFVPKSDVKPSLAKRLMEFTWLVSQSGDGEFGKRIADFVDLRQLARFTAVHTVLSHLDSFLLRGHNFYLYLPKADDRFTFLPWDVNSTFASHRSAGSPEQQFNLSISHPFTKGQRLMERLMKMKSFREPYEDSVKELVTTHFSKESVTRDMKELSKVVEKSVKEDQYSDYREFKANFALEENTPSDSLGLDKLRGGFRVVRKPLLREFVEKRHESIAAQLAGKQEGYVPASRRR